MQKCRKWTGLPVLLGFAAGCPGLLSQSLELQGSAPSRYREVSPEGTGRTGFTVMDNARLGITWTNSLPVEEYGRRQNLMNGAGLALGDFDGDGRPDIYLCNRFGPNALYRNLGNWRFEDVTERAGVACPEMISSGAVFADVDGDGRLDLLVTSFNGPHALFLNRGDGSFTNVTASSGLSPRGGATSFAMGDFEGNGLLGMYVCYLGVEAIFRDGAAFSTRMVGGKLVPTGRFARRLQLVDGLMYELGEPDIYYRNLGSGQFAAVDWPSAFRDVEGRPMKAPLDMGLAVQVRDINEDGLPDIYVCNDFQTPDQVWMNQGGGQFQAMDRWALRNMSYAAMGVDFADIDRDGRLDIVVVDMLSRDHRRHLRQASPMGVTRRQIGQFAAREDVTRNTLYWNRGDGTYAEIAWFGGVAASDWSWTPIFLDVDLDGYEDLLISNGHLHDVNDRDAGALYRQSVDPSRALRGNTSALGDYPALNATNAAFRNLGGLKFEDVSEAWGFGVPKITHGMALADLDNDGDLDVVANVSNAGPLIYRNDGAAPRVSVRLRGNAPNTQAIGAVVTLHGGPFPQKQEIVSGARYLSGDDPTRTFAVPSGSGGLSLEVRWRNGRITRVPDVRANRYYEISEEGSEPPAPRPAGKEIQPLFEDLTAELNHVHHEAPFEDFIRQPMIPKKLTQLGPGIAWIDLNQDGYEELVIGAGRGGRVTVHDNNAGKLQARPIAGPPLPDDSAGIAGWHDGQPRLLVGMAQYERPQMSAAPLLATGESGFSAIEELGSGPVSTGPLAVADIDGDGDLDLFIGGRFIPGKYPAATSSRLFRNDHGKLVPHEQANSVLKDAGMVSGAIFTDLDGDGFAELVLACEWGPVRVFKNEGGRTFTEVTSGLGLAGMTGLWTSIAAGDFNGDGRMDLVAGNIGLNSYHQRAPQGPWFLYHGDLNQDGRHVIIEAYHNPAMGAVVPFRDRDFLSVGMPWLAERFPRHREFASASVARILGERMAQMKEVKAVELRSMVFWNRGGHFEAEPLPDEAQWSQAFGLNVADFNGDGHEDIFLAQNFFSVRPEDDRLDGGRSLLLLGSREGKLTPMPGQESGLKIYGEQRGSAAADFDGDGRVDLAVTQNGAETRLFRNTGPAGLRVRLQGPAGNPAGYGAVARWRMGGAAGPVREVHAGSGYWSQNGAIQVLHGIPAGAELVVRWPGGKETRNQVPAGAREIALNYEGEVRALR